MSKQITTDISEHLAALLDSSPSGIAKLIAAWDGLSTESQIAIMIKLGAARLPAYLDERVRMVAIGSSNAYVRYLAARNLDLIVNPTAARTVKQRIEDDPSPLVRYCLLENEFGGSDAALKDPEVFFAFPHEARLAKIRLLNGWGETIASFINYAVDHLIKDGKVSEVELDEILSDYVNKPSFREYHSTEHWQNSYDGYGEFLAGKDIEALWKLVPKLPERISYVLIEHLPFQARLSTEIPKDVLDTMTPGQLSTLLYRDDIPLKELRKDLFSRPVKDRFDQVRSAAIAHHFDFSHAEFAEILAKPEKDKIDLLRDLSFLANDLSLVFYDAIHDVLFSAEVNDFGGTLRDAAEACESLQRKLSRLKGWQRDSELRELRLYRLARRAVPWKTEETAYPPSTELEFLSKLIVENDTWATFMAFSQTWERSPRNKMLEKHLPRIDEAGESYEEDEVEDSLNEKLSAILAKFKDSDDTGQTKLMEAFGDFARYTSQAIEQSLETMNRLKSEMDTLLQAQLRQKLLMLLAIGLIVWLIVRRW